MLSSGMHFQLTLRGYDPETSDTDNLIKWVRAHNEKAALIAAREAGWDVIDVSELVNPNLSDSDMDMVVWVRRAEDEPDAEDFTIFLNTPAGSGDHPVYKEAD